MVSLSQKLVIGFPGAQWVLRGETYDDLDWVDPILQKPTQTEVEEAFNSKSHEKALSILRTMRDEKLTQTDKYLIPDFPITEEKRDKYIAYRTALRDMTKTAMPQLTETVMGNVSIDETSVTWPQL